MKTKWKLETTSLFLHGMAMVFMLCDHLWGTIVPGNDWMTCVGRMAFPVFAFLLVEGFFHTANLKRYAGRLLVAAIVSEIPFNLAIGGRVFYPVHQNVLWSFLLCLLLLFWNEKARATGKLWLRVLTGAGTALLGYVLGLLTMVDYLHGGVLMVLVFYFFRGKSLWCFMGQLLCLWYIGAELLGGYTYEFYVFGEKLFFIRQNFALFALIPIWLYGGRQGYYNKTIRAVYYAFYPVHLLLLGLVRFL